MRQHKTVIREEAVYMPRICKVDLPLPAGIVYPVTGCPHGGRDCLDCLIPKCVEDMTASERRTAGIPPSPSHHKREVAA